MIHKMYIKMGNARATMSVVEYAGMRWDKIAPKLLHGSQDKDKEALQRPRWMPG